MSEEKHPQTVMPSFLKSATPEQLNEFVEWVSNLATRSAMEAVDTAVPLALGKSLRTIGYTDELLRLASSLAARSQESKETVLRKALNLYRFALEAGEQGNRMSILNRDDEIVGEVVGFEPIMDSAPQQHAAG